MSETTGKPAQCMAITEKKPHRPGGCVGIFFQLLDWNRKFAKKKLFSRKLLPPVRAKKFGGDDKMPKTKPHLISDESNGGFPKNGNVSEITGQKHEMKAAGLVVRLMGLESLPTVNDKQKKASNSDVEEDKFDDLNSGKGSVKVECRPQKLQKTGQFDRSAVTRFGAEALQIKKVLSRSRKEQYSKLASPVKSPRLSSSRNVSRTSRLIDVASRILEPGLQATSRAKCAISYTGSMNYAQKSEGLVDGVGLGAMPTDLGAAKSFGGQSSCRNCGNLIEANGFKPEIEKQASAYPFSAEKMSLQGSERIVLRPTVHDLEQEGPEGLKHDNKRACNDETSATVFQQRTETRTNMSVGRSRNQPQRPQKDEMSVGRSRIPSKAKSNNLQNRKACSTGNAITGAKDFVALNRSLSSSSPSRVLSKVDNCSPRDDSLSQARTPVRKRRTGSVNTQPESTGIANSKPVRPKNIKCDLVGGKRLEPNAPNGSQECIKARTSSSSQGAFKDHDAVSFTFNSQLRHKNLISPRLTKTRDQIDKIPNGLLFEEKEGKTFFKGKMPLNGDSLGALLELKLKELTSQGEDELMVGGKRSTAVILQELISALTAQQPFSPNSPMETGEKARKAPVGSSHDREYLSPGSVLEASFSNSSCLSSSLEDFSGRRLVYDSVDNSCDQLQPIEADAYLLDSATFMNKRNAVNKTVTVLLNHTSRALQSIHLASGGLMGSRFDYAKEVILNAELLYSSVSIQNSARRISFLIGPDLFDDLEVPPGPENCKDGSGVKRFLFDCVIEYLDSKYGRFCDLGFKAWRKVQLDMNTEMLIEEVVEEIRRWTSFAGMLTNELIEWEMSHSLGKWTDFEIEEFETGVGIGWEILEDLVDETVMEFRDCRMVSF